MPHLQRRAEMIAGSAVIIEVVRRPYLAAWAATVVLAGCGSGLRSKEKVQQAIVERLQTRSGLDLNSLDVTTTSVSFDKNLAYATVAFHPKGDSRVNSGMVMKYTLEDRDNKWVVIKVGDAQGHTGMGTGSGADALPPGHPPVGSESPQAGGVPEGKENPQ
jgi:hypothetical protein